MVEQPKASKRGIWGWMFFDWAAQPFFTVVTTFIFGPYVVSRMVDDPTSGQAAWAAAVAVAGLFIAFLSPVLGSIADKTGPRKPWIGLFAILKICALLGLWYAAPGSNLFWVLALFILATVAAEFSIVFNDSMMPSLVSTKQVGRVSNVAWALGYAGGLVMLFFVLLFLAANPESGLTLLGSEPLFGLDPKQAEGDRATAPLAAMWYLVFILPMFIFTPDLGERAASLGDAVKNGLSDLKETVAEARRRPGIFRFLVSRMIYQDGVNALTALGGTFAAAMFGWSITELGIFGIILNLVAIPCCLIAASLDPKLGSKKLVVISIVILMIATIGIVSTGPNHTLFGLLTFEATVGDGLFGSGAEKAYIVYGCLVGAAFGPIQASSRSYMSRSVHKSESGRFFGLYAFAGRATSFLAPATVSFVTYYSGSAVLGMASLLVFFVVGLWVLWGTPYPAAEVKED